MSEMKYNTSLDDGVQSKLDNADNDVDAVTQLDIFPNIGPT